MKRRLWIEALSLVLIAEMFAMAAASWSTAPDRIPMHWNDQGQVDRFGGRAEGLLLLPVIAAGLYLLLLILPSNDARSSGAGASASSGFGLFFRTALTAVLFTVYAAVHLWIRGWTVNMSSVVLW